MNIAGIFVCVALPAFALGVSAAAWIIRSGWTECEHCHEMFRARICRPCAEAWPLDRERLTDIHHAR